MKRILLAVNDTPAGIAALRAAIALAEVTSGQVRVVHVLAEDVLPASLGGPESSDSEPRREAGSAAVLRFATDLAARAGVSVETATLHGRPATLILEQATAWRADVIVLGRAGLRRVGAPFVGSEVLHVLEFAEVPVLVVPAH